jgi:hypothetical protein
VKLLLQIFFLFLTWFTNLNATPVFTKVVIPSYELTFSKIENVIEENAVKIGVQNYARSGIEDENNFPSILNGEVWESVTSSEKREKEVNGAGRWLSTFKNRLVSRLQSSSGFTLIHTDAEITQITNKGKSLNLTDDIIDDMLFISCRNVKAINASELMTQMDNWVNVVSKRGYPYKFNDIGQFNSFKNELKTGLNDINVTTSDVRIQGSSLRTPNANDVDLAAIISETDFDNFLVNRFNNKITKNSTVIDLSNKSKLQLIDIANDYNLNPSLYNNQAKSFSKSMLDRKVSAYSNDKVIPGFKELYNSVKGNYPNLNIENITIQTLGGSFDLKPFIKL